MKIGDKVIITGGTPKDWHRYGKPYYHRSNSLFRFVMGTQPLLIADSIYCGVTRTYW